MEEEGEKRRKEGKKRRGRREGRGRRGEEGGRGEGGEEDGRGGRRSEGAVVLHTTLPPPPPAYSSSSSSTLAPSSSSWPQALLRPSRPLHDDLRSIEVSAVLPSQRILQRRVTTVTRPHPLEWLPTTRPPLASHSRLPWQHSSGCVLSRSV